MNAANYINIEVVLAGITRYMGIVGHYRVLQIKYIQNLGGSLIVTKL